jgi:hypothetical protein
MHGLYVVHIAPLTELVPGLEVSDHEVAVHGDAPFVDLVNNRQEFPSFPFGGDATAPDPLEDL